MLHILRYLFFILFTFFFTNAMSAETEWSSGIESKVRLISPSSYNNNLSEIYLGLEYQLQDGWKTYWKSPGDGGFPQEINWSNSENIKALEILWPTPSYFEILNLLQIASDNKVKFVFMEVSSIGYCEGRIGNLIYNYCILTNLESDHLDYHRNINNYHTAKLNLIKLHKLKNSILFLQDFNLKNKFKSFDKYLYVQEEFLSKNKISIVNKSYNKYLITD